MFQPFEDIQMRKIWMGVFPGGCSFVEEASNTVNLNNIEDENLDPALLENTEIFQTLEEISTIVDDIKQLGQE